MIYSFTQLFLSVLGALLHDPIFERPIKEKQTVKNKPLLCFNLVIQSWFSCGWTMWCFEATRCQWSKGCLCLCSDFNKPEVQLPLGPEKSPNHLFNVSQEEGTMCVLDTTVSILFGNFTALKSRKQQSSKSFERMPSCHYYCYHCCYLMKDEYKKRHALTMANICV